MCRRFLENVGFQNIITACNKNRVKVISILPNYKHICFLSQISFESFEEVYTEKRIIYNDKKYEIGDVICVKEISIPVFGIIEHIFINQNRKIRFVYIELKTISHNEHLYAYEVKPTDLLKCILLSDVIFVDHLLICTLGSKQYITIF